MGTYWQNQTSGVSRGLGNLSSALIQIPRIQMMQRYRDQQAQTAAAREQAYADEARAHADVYRGQKSAMDDDSAADTRLQDALTRMTKNPNDTDAQADVISGFGRAYKKNPEGTAKSLGDVFAMIQARGGSTNYDQMGALQGGAAKIGANQDTLAAKAKAPVVLPNGGSLVDPTLGNIIASAGATVGPGGARVAPMSGDDASTIEATNPGPAKSSAVGAVRARFVAQVLNNTKMDPKAKRQAIETYDAQNGGNPEPGAATPPDGPSPLTTALTQGQGMPPAAAPVDGPGQAEYDDTATAGPTAAHVQALLQHPELAGQFDAKFGPGMSAQYLKPPAPAL